MVIINAVIHTMENQDYECGFLRIREGKIVGIGSMNEYELLPDEEILNAEGAEMLPGFIDAHTHLGMWEDGLTFEGDDGNEETDPVTPHLRGLDAVNPMDRCFQEAASGGVTTVLTGPGSANAIAGSWCALKTLGKRIDSMALVKEIGMKFALGENPKSVYHGRDEAPFTRMATAALIREQLHKALRYLRDIEKYEENPEEEDLPEYDAKCEALLPVLRREQKAFIHAHRADDLFTAVRIADEFQLDAILVHGTEGYLVSEELKETGYPIITGPLFSDRSKPELKQQSIENPARLREAGILAAICTDHPVIPVQYLPLSAGLAVRGGLSKDEALKMITRYPAEICGLEDRVGSLKVGKDADLVLYRGDPLDIYFKPIQVFVNGKKVLPEALS